MLHVMRRLSKISDPMKGPHLATEYVRSQHYLKTLNRSSLEDEAQLCLLLLDRLLHASEAGSL